MAVQNQKLSQQQQRERATTTTSAATATAETSLAAANANAATTATIPAEPAMPSTSQTQSAAQAAAAAANGGPRVSFNRDVHVKRIGKRPNDSTNYETTNLQPPQNTVPYHQLPADLSAENIRKEAALVLAQAERHRSKAGNTDSSIPFFKLKSKKNDPKKFHSLPTRKKKGAAKPVSRSVSDAAAKKPTKRPSIFSIFSRKSDSNVSQIERDPRFEDSGGRRLVRSKSDVGSSTKEERKVKKTKAQKEPKQTVNGSAKQLSTPLTPIIEHAQKEEEYFAEQYNRERRKSDAITDREKHESGVSELLERSRSQAEVDGSVIAKTPVSSNIRDKILTLQARSNENMHSSQLPAQKLPLTKGVTVNGMVKRLSMERFSPPPTISGPAFSYIRPNEGITYAQLDLSDDQLASPQYSEQIRPATREIRTPLREFRSPAREVRSTERELRTLSRPSTERADFVTSHSQTKHVYPQHYSNNNNHSSSRVIIEGPTRTRDSFTPVTGPTTIRISSSHSPSPWQQLSPRNLSDEDEGLGIETRKYYDDELAKMRSKSPAEPPIVPVIRSITPPRESDYNARAYLSPSRDDGVDDLGYRRARLESRILTRRFGDPGATLDRNGHHNSSSPEYREVREGSTLHRYLNAERERHEPRFHKPETTEILHKYSPERSHLDMIAPSQPSTSRGNSVPKTEKTSRYKHTKYYDDGRGGVKEVYERETHMDAEGKPHERESRHRERLDSYTGKGEHSSTERQLLNDYEPKSLDSQFTSTDQYRSSPENMKRYELSTERSLPQQRLAGEDQWHSTLKRDKLQQRSFDKGDSGIENDFRKESFNGDISTRWRKRTVADDMKACDSFLKKERRHTEQLYGVHRHDHNYIYRERSIDDGSHYDPHLDKYPVAKNTLRRKDQQSQTGQGQDTLKRNKKLGGFEKVKQLFTGSNGHGNGNTKKETDKNVRAHSTTSSSTQMTPKDNKDKDKEKDKDKDKDKYMVKEKEMRARYREHRVNLPNETLSEPKATDISMRRRLSTPKASPLLLKRTSSDKTKKESPLAKPEKTSWFKSLDRRSKSKSKEKLDVPVAEPTDTSSMKRSKPARPTPAPAAMPPKNLRFFGDTDLDSNPPTVSKANTTQKTRPSLPSTLNRSQKYSQSAYHLDRINGSPQRTDDYRHALSSANNNNNHSINNVSATRHKSNSMHNLEKGGADEVDFRKRRHYSRSRDLENISESGSETEDQQKRPNGAVAGARTLSRERLDRTHRYDEHAYRRSNERQAPTMPPMPANGVDVSHTNQRRPYPLTGPPKPARSAERRVLSSYSRERDRFPAESSGTEGESSLHSQRSIVYLHATTVGAIPQPYHLRRRALSRDDLRSNKSKNQPLQPMTRTVSRSVSMLAPWKPKLISEGYEINYSQEQNKRMSTLPRKPHLNGNSSTLTRNGKKSEMPMSRSRRHEFIKDDQSTTSASKSALSTNARNADARRKPK